MAETDDRVALITGGASGIGAATAERLGRDGTRLVLADIDAEGLEEAAARLGGPDRALGVVTDLRSFADCERAVATAVERFGRLDILVNCAGVWVEGPTDTMTEADWDRVVDVNLKGTFAMCRHAIPALEATGGCIVNVSSDAGLWGNKGAAIYCASKGGVTVLSKALAVELAERGIRVNAVCPGIIDTPMQDAVLEEISALRGTTAQALSDARTATVPMRRGATPEECAGAIWFLLSDDSSYVTGEALNVSGGLAMW